MICYGLTFNDAASIFCAACKKEKVLFTRKWFDQGFFSYSHFPCMTKRNISHFLINRLRRNETSVPWVGCQNYIEGDQINFDLLYDSDIDHDNVTSNVRMYEATFLT